MKHRLICLLLIALLTISCITGCSGTTSENSGVASDDAYEEDSALEDEGLGDGEIVSFRPVDCGIQAESTYTYPYAGLMVMLQESLLEKLDSRDVFLYNFEECTADAVSYAMMRFSAPTEEQKNEEGMTVDIFSWEESLPKIGVIGVYEKSLAADLDELTLCDTHVKICESEDGKYNYYLSTNSNGDASLVEALRKSGIAVTEMLPIDLENGYSAFSPARVEGVENVGDFVTEDIFGETYDKTVFKGYDLTLVNVFATWCSPCVQEMPELEKLRQECNEKGIKLGVVAVVMDAKVEDGLDSTAIEKAKALAESSKAQFPFIIPDETGFDGRLEGIMAYPESFFVDSEGNIISDPYVGARNSADWAEIVSAELAKLNGEG